MANGERVTRSRPAPADVSTAPESGAQETDDQLREEAMDAADEQGGKQEVKEVLKDEQKDVDKKTLQKELRSKVEEAVKRPKVKTDEKERESSRKEKEREGDRKDTKSKESSRSHREKETERRGEEKSKDEKSKSDRHQREGGKKKEDDRGKRDGKEVERRKDDDKSKREAETKVDDRDERHRRESDRSGDKHRREEDRRRKEEFRKKDDAPRKDSEKDRKRDPEKDRRGSEREKRDSARDKKEPEKERKTSERDRRDPEKDKKEVKSGASALPPPPPLPANAEVEKVDLGAIKEKDKGKEKDSGDRARREEKSSRREKEEPSKDKGRSDRDRGVERPRESERPREGERHRERERERDRGGRRPPTPPRRRHRSRSRSLSPRRRSPPRSRRSPPPSRPVNKRAGYYSSGLGGYSPRRRKNGDRDSPELSPDRKRSKGMGGAWDQPPPGMDAAAIALWQQQVAVAQQAAVAAGANPFIAMGAASNLPNLNPLFPGLGGAQNPAVTRSQRRLYIGNLPPTVSDGELLEFLNAAIISSGQQHVPGTRPVTAVQLTLDKGFGFADFTHPEDATHAMLLDGIVLHGNALKIRRPRDYVPNPSEMLSASATGLSTALGAVGVTGQPILAAPGTVTTASSIPLSAIPQNIVPGFISTDVPDGPNKIYLGNINPAITAEKLREILTAFGQLKHYVMKINKDVKPFKVSAYVEYMDSAVTAQAIAGLSGLMLARRPLVAAYATPLTPLQDSDKEPFYGVPDAAKPLLEEPSKVLELINILTCQELLSLSDEEIEEVVEDATLECARFGTVKSHHLPKPVRTAKQEGESDSKDGVVKAENGTDSQAGLLQNGAVKAEPMDEDAKAEDGNVEDADEEDDKKQVVLLGGMPAAKKEEDGNAEEPEGVGKLYVEFSREESAIRAAHALHNRMYNLRRVGVAYFPVKLYQKLYGKGFGLSHKSYDERQELSIKVQDFLYGPVEEGK